MERKLAQPTFTDALMLDYGSPRMAAFFAEMDAVVPWADLAASIADVFDDSDSDKGGRPHWPLVLMVKCLMLQKWFGLSDPGLEEMLCDRLSFRRFVGLSLDERTPDETTFVRFRGRLVARGHGSTLFDAVTRLLSERGVIVNEGTLVDASVQQTSRGRWSRATATATATATGGAGGAGDAGDAGDAPHTAELHTRDKGASNTRLYGRTLFGFKGHIATDVRGFAKDYRFDTAATHESRHFESLTAGETKAVWADKAYWKVDRVARLTLRGVFAGIGVRRVRGQAHLTPGQKAHNRLVAKVRFVVEHPFAWMKARGWGRARYRGLARNGFDFALTLAACNLHRARDLLLAHRALANA
jgi:IS5 family transposase